jgi:phospholipid/cholesterol/gamma-HCH transport system ATP-binding protein
MMVGLLTPDSGEIFYEDKEFVSMNNIQKQVVRQEIGMLFQNGALFDSLTLEQNVIFPLDMFTKMSEEEKLERANYCLHKVKLEGKNALFPAELSGGMRKRAALARAISASPKYLFCDEPNSGLDPKTAIVIDQLIHEITIESNITTVVITHDMNSVMEIGENILFIYNGQSWWKGTNKEILSVENKELLDLVYASEFMKKTRPRKT